MRIKRIEITQQDIEKGIRGDSWECPIVHAARRDFHEAKNFFVNRRKIHFFFEGKYCQDELDRRAKEFVAAFDNGKLVEPFIFEIWL